MDHCKAHFDNLKEITLRMSDIVTALKTLNCGIPGLIKAGDREAYSETKQLLTDELCNLAMSVYLIGCGCETPPSGRYTVDDHSVMFGMIDDMDPGSVRPRP